MTYALAMLLGAAAVWTAHILVKRPKRADVQRVISTPSGDIIGIRTTTHEGDTPLLIASLQQSAHPTWMTTNPNGPTQMWRGHND